MKETKKQKIYVGWKRDGMIKKNIKEDLYFKSHK